MTAVRRSIRRRLALLAVLALLVTGTVVLLKGCTATVIPPPDVRDPVAVYIIDYGRHPGIVLPRSEREYIEYSYGEWKWFALGHAGFGDAFRALLVPSTGALGRRSFYHDPDRERPWWGDVPLKNLHELTVERERAESLLSDLDKRWEANRETAVYNPVHELDFVVDEQEYHLWTNSNIILGRWLEQLDVDVRGWPLYPMRWRVRHE